MDDFTSNSCGMSTHCCATDTQSAPMTTVTGTEDFTTNSSGMPTHFWEADAQSAPMTAATGTGDSATNPFGALSNHFWPHNMFAPYSGTDTQPAPPAATAADAREPLSSAGSRFGGQHGTTMAASQQAAVAARLEDQPHHSPSACVPTPYGPTRRVCMCPPEHCLVLAAALLLNMIFWVLVIVLALGLAGLFEVADKTTVCVPTGMAAIAAYCFHWGAVLAGPLKELADRGAISAPFYYFMAFICLDGVVVCGVYGTCC
jgi:hypothetical protein